MSDAVALHGQASPAPSRAADLGNKPTDMRGDGGGWFRPCHGSQYDTSGRVRHGPAPVSLAVPGYAFDTDSKITIG